MASVFRKQSRKTGKDLPEWRFKFRDHSGKWRYGIGWKDRQKTLDHARDVEAEHRAVGKGEKAIPPAWLKKRNTPITEVIESYISWGQAQGGRNGYGWDNEHAEEKRRSLEQWVEALGLVSLRDIDLERVEARARELLKLGRHGKTVTNAVESIRSLCIYGVKRGYLERNPLAGISKFDTTPKRPHRALSDDELRDLLMAAPPKRVRWYRVALATGYRLSELRALKICNLDPFGPSLTLPAPDTKNRKPAKQYISRELMQELQDLGKGKEPEDPLLDVVGNQTAGEYLAEDFKSAGITRVTLEGKATFHSFRVTYINNVVESGSDLKTIMTLARHGSASMSMETYAKAKPDRLRQAANAAALRVAEAQKPDPCCSDVARKVVGGELESCNANGEKTLVVVGGWLPGQDSNLE